MYRTRLINYPSRDSDWILYTTKGDDMRPFIIGGLLMTHCAVFASACQTQRQVFLDNAETKVWRSTICPHERLAFHTHDHARVVIPEEDGQLKVIYKSGKTGLIDLHRQTPAFLSVAQGKDLHQDENTGSRPLHVMVIELKGG